jgi:hypothetical protein
MVEELDAETRGRNMKRLAALLAAFFFTLSPCVAEGNASNPLAKVKNTDVRAQYFDNRDGSYRWDFWAADGAFMATDKLKIKYEIHYSKTDVTGSSENDLESIHLKPIYFPKMGTLGKWKYSLAVGAEWIKDFDNRDKGIGFGGDQIAPLVGLAMVKWPGWVFIPLLQHFMDYSGDDINQTAFRLIAIQTLPKKSWLKYDLKVPIDWENDNAVLATGEVQLGMMFKKNFGAYADVLAGIGSDRPYDWGTGVGVRFVY